MVRGWWMLGFLAACGVPAETDGPVVTDPTVPTDTTDPTSPTVDPTACVPSEAAFETNALRVIDTWCGECHGATPRFGAPFSLTEYAPLIEGEVGERIVDRMADELIQGTMPPGNAGPMPHAEEDTLISWASCGAKHPHFDEDLEASQPVFRAPDEPPEGTVPVEITADEEPIGPTVLDDYRTFSFTNIVEEDKFIRRIEPVVDDGRVLHHITVRASTTSRYLYTWAPGTSAIQFPDGGIRLRPNDRLEIEIHYNNGSGAEGVRDSSGVRLFLADVEGTEYTMLEPTSWMIWVPDGQQRDVTATCTARNDFTVLAGIPHMHEIGSTFDQWLIREDGEREEMITLTGWSFEAQYFYEMPFEVHEGDQIELTCGFDNQTGSLVTAGLRTQDEMCYDFMYATPANAELDCD